MKAVLYFLFLIFVAPSLWAQSTREITGRVLDDETKMPISNAAVIVYGTTQGTITNHLGFFQLKVGGSVKSLVISSIGYQTSLLNIPEVNQFSIILEREYRKIVELDLRSFVPQELPVLDSVGVMRADGLIESDAEYPGSWEYFLNDLSKELLKNPLSSLLHDTLRTVRFTVGKEGLVTNVKPMDGSSEVKGLVAEALRNTRRWYPARQNKLSVAQHFEIPLTWTMKVDTPTSDDVFTVVEEPAKPRGGMMEFYKHVGNEMKYPPEARRNGISGKVFVEFRVEPDGTLSNARVIKGIGFGCDEEAMRAVLSAPRWDPGKQSGKAVRQRIVLPITFRLDNYGEPPSNRVLFKRRLEEAIAYPASARRMGVEGWVFVKFHVNKGTGDITAIQILKDIGAGCGAEIVEELRKIPIYVTKDLHPTKELYVVPVGFGLDHRLDSKTMKFVSDGVAEILEPVDIVAIGVEREGRATGFMPIEIVPMSNLSSQGSSLEAILERNPKTPRLSLVGKQLQSIPPAIQNFKNLQFLDLENNRLTSLPPEITKLSKLTELYVPNNELTTLPMGFEEMQNLKILGMANNKLERFPSSLTNLAKLEALDLGGNKIIELPEEIMKLKKLKVLFLQDNQLKTLPAGLLEMKSLDAIYLQGNPLDLQDLEKLKSSLKKTKVLF